MKSSCAFLVLLEKLERWIIPMTALQLGTRLPWLVLPRRHPNSLRCLLDCSMLWHASAAHLQSLPSRACCAGTKHSGGRGTHVKLSQACCGFWSQNALPKKHKVQHANRHRLINSFFSCTHLRRSCESALTVISPQVIHSTSVFWQLEILLIIRLVHGCVALCLTALKPTDAVCWRISCLRTPPASVLFHIWWCWLSTIHNLFFLPLCSLFYSASFVISQKTKQTTK